MKPGAGIGPHPFGTALGDAQQSRRLDVGQADEEPHFNELGSDRILDSVLVQGFVDGQQLLVVAGCREVERIELDALKLAPVFEAVLAAGFLNQNAAHGLGRRGEEVAATVPGRGLPVLGQAQPGLVDQRGRLEGLAGRQLSHLVAGKAAQFLVDQREQLLRLLGFTAVDRIQKPRYFTHESERIMRQSPPLASIVNSIVNRLAVGVPYPTLAPMRTILFHSRVRGYATCRVALMTVACVLAAWLSRAAESTGEFSNPRIDIGLVARDAARTASFLTNAIGFREVTGFPVSPELGRKIGLIDGHPVDVRVFVLGDGEEATRLKVLAFPAAQGVQADQRFIHATFGYRYLTLYVKDVNQALERLKRANIPLLGETPVDLGGGTHIVVVKDPDGNFIELIGPRKP